VSASGVRGESIEIDVGEIGGDLVYIPCSIGAGNHARRPVAARALRLDLRARPAPPEDRMIALALYLTFGTAFMQAPASEVPPPPRSPLRPWPPSRARARARAARRARARASGRAVRRGRHSRHTTAPAEAPPLRVRVPARITAGISPLPSLDLAFFFGGRCAQPVALGYQFTFSAGVAERYLEGFVTHRHHLTAMRSFGARDRGFVSVGGGIALLAVSATVIEAETRVGLRFGPRRRGVVAALTRLGWNVGFREQAPMPQFGVVLGVALF
jgi:hypothetical protein